MVLTEGGRQNSAAAWPSVIRLPESRMTISSRQAFEGGKRQAGGCRLRS